MAQKEDITVDQGSDFSMQLSLVNTDGSKKNLTGYSVAGQIRRTYNTSDSDAINFTAVVNTPQTDGIVTLDLSNAQTDAMEPERYVYDVEISYVDSDANTIIERVLEGRVDVTPSVTKG